MQKWDIGTTPEGNKVMYKEDHGRFILYSDAKAIEEERDRLKAELAEREKEVERLTNIIETLEIGC